MAAEPASGRGSNGGPRPSAPPGAAGDGPVPGRLRPEPEAVEFRDIVPQPASPRPGREETVESRTAVSERVS